MAMTSGRLARLCGSRRALALAAVGLAMGLLARPAVLAAPSGGMAGSESVAQSTITPVLPPPAPTVTALPSPPTPIPSPPGNVCPQIVNHVPAAAISAALADPWRIGGYNRLVDPSKPESPHNPMRTWLTLTAINKPYHWLWNSLIFRAGCP